MLLHLVKETDQGIVVRGAKYETAPPMPTRLSCKPTIANWGDDKLSDYALVSSATWARRAQAYLPHRFCRPRCGQGLPALQPLRRGRYPAGVRRRAGALGECALLSAHPRGRAYIRGTLHRYSAYPLHLRLLYIADLMLGAAMFNASRPASTCSKRCARSSRCWCNIARTINAHLIACIAMAQTSPGGLLMPNPSMLYTGRYYAINQLPAMMHIARELCGGQICVTPDSASFGDPEIGAWLDKYYSVNEFCRRKTGASCSLSHADC
jgi:4-hydroxyphenylacetate 3-monooxygenase